MMERTADTIANTLEEKLKLHEIKKRVSFIADSEGEAQAVAFELSRRGHRASTDTGINLFKGTAHHCVVIEPPKKEKKR